MPRRALLTSLLPLFLFATTSPTSAADRGVELRWDDYGVAHVTADDFAGLWFGYGYAQFASHGNLILKLYGESRGRAAEYLGPFTPEPGTPGPGTDNLANGRWVHRNDAPARAAHWLDAQTPAYRAAFSAFAAGMNAAAAPTDIATPAEPILATARPQGFQITPPYPTLHRNRAHGHRREPELTNDLPRGASHGRGRRFRRPPTGRSCDRPTGA